MTMTWILLGLSGVGFFLTVLLLIILIATKKKFGTIVLACLPVLLISGILGIVAGGNYAWNWYQDNEENLNINDALLDYDYNYNTNYDDDYKIMQSNNLLNQVKHTIFIGWK